MAAGEHLPILLSKLESPLPDEGPSIRAGNAEFIPTDQEGIQIRTNLGLREKGIGVLPRGRPCSLFIQENMEEATRTANLLTDIPTLTEFMRTCAAIRQVVNEEIYVFALMSAVQNRKDTKTMRLPPIEEVVPYWYFPSSVINTCRRRVTTAANQEAKVVVEYRFAGNLLDPEFRTAYYREDIALNSHHWHWHLAYPYTWVPRPGQMRDRKGELFYYMHQQMLARYDCERLSNHLNRVRPLNDLDMNLEEGYSPQLLSTLSGRFYPGRPGNTKLQDVGVNAVVMGRLETWRNRILEAIHTGRLVPPKEGKPIPLTEEKGIDMLGALVEAAAISVNREYYGNYHNLGHTAISRIHDPDGRYGGDMGVMAFSSTSMRDPIFYRWHKDLDDIFDEYKRTLPPYSRQQLGLSDVTVMDLTIKGDSSQRANMIQTYWQQREVIISRGIDFGRENPVVVRATHLQHEGFNHMVEVDNTTGKPKEVTVRLFMAPKFNEVQEEIPFPEQRRLFIELDKYFVTLKPGKQRLTRHSKESNVTVPANRSFETLQNLPTTELPNTQQSFCGCGWPDHLLVPKGRAEGMTYTYFVMLSDAAIDKVVDENPNDKPTCSDAASYCGLANKKYPDSRPMGFPFDRRPESVVLTAADFVTSSPNMRVADVVIRHTGEIVGVDGVFQPAPVF